MRKLLFLLLLRIVVKLNAAVPSSTNESPTDYKNVDFTYEIKINLMTYERYANVLKKYFKPWKAESDLLIYTFRNVPELFSAYKNYRESITDLNLACRFNLGAYELYGEHCLDIGFIKSGDPVEQQSHLGLKCIKILKGMIKTTMETTLKANMVIDQSFENIVKNLDEALLNFQKGNFSKIAQEKRIELRTKIENEEKKIKHATSIISHFNDDKTIKQAKSKINDLKNELYDWFDVYDISKFQYEWIQNIKDEFHKDLTDETLNDLSTFLKSKQELADGAENFLRGLLWEKEWQKEKFDELTKSVSKIYKRSCGILIYSNHN